MAVVGSVTGDEANGGRTAPPSDSAVPSARVFPIDIYGRRVLMQWWSDSVRPYGTFMCYPWQLATHSEVRVGARSAAVLFWPRAVPARRRIDRKAEISIGEQLIRWHTIKHDRTRLHGALANPGGRPRSLNRTRPVNHLPKSPRQAGSEA